MIRITGVNISYPVQRSMQEQTLQIDYYDPLSPKQQIECGLKGIYRQNSTNSDTYLLNPTANFWDYSSSKSNDLDYDQDILAAYAGYTYKIKAFTLKGGLRAEFTWNNATSTSESVVKFSNQFQNIVPYITLNYQSKSGKNIKISYTQRLSRPGISYLNPYVNNSDPQNIIWGNPKLKSEVAHTVELVYSAFTRRININFSGRGAFTNNAIESVSTINADGVKSTTYNNIGTDMSFLTNLYCSYRVSNKVTLSCNAIGYYAKMKANNGHGSFKLNKLPFYSGFYEVRAYTKYMLNFGDDVIFSRTFAVYDKPTKPGAYEEKSLMKYGRGAYPVFRKPPVKEKAVTLKFYPEGGNLVAGVPSQVAFEATDAYGNPIDITGEIVTEAKETIVRFKSVHDGKGVFTYTPTKTLSIQKSKTDKFPQAFVNYKDKKYTFNLPVVQPQGVVLKIDNLSSPDSIGVSVLSNSDTPRGIFGLALLSGSYLHKYIMERVCE